MLLYIWMRYTHKTAICWRWSSSAMLTAAGCLVIFCLVTAFPEPDYALQFTYIDTFISILGVAAAITLPVSVIVARLCSPRTKRADRIILGVGYVALIAEVVVVLSVIIGVTLLIASGKALEGLGF